MGKRINARRAAEKKSIQEKGADFIGTVGLKLINLTTGEKTNIKNHNQVVYVGRHRVGRVVGNDAGVSADQKTISTLKIGDGACPVDPFINVEAEATDSDLFTYVATYEGVTPTFNDVSSSSGPMLTYYKVLTCTEVDSLINEIGLYFDEGGPMFAHYTFPTIDLRTASNNALEITWEVLF